jgi:hypothetical protein
MRAKEFLKETITIIFENTTSDELIPYLKQLGFDSIDKMTGKTIRVVVPSAIRATAADQILSVFPEATKSADGKIVYYDGATIKIKPAEQQGTASLQKEITQRNIIDDAIKQAMGQQEEILLTVGNRRIKAAGAHPAHPGVKADIVIQDAAGKDTAWVSLKDGTTAKHFRHWGGVTHQPVVSHSEVEDFINTAIMTFGQTGIPDNGVFGREITDPQLSNWSVFGKNFGGAPGESNVDLVLQGHPKVINGPEGYELTGDHHWPNGDTPSGEYEPCLLILKRGDRSNFKIPGARFSVVPKGGKAFTKI